MIMKTFDWKQNGYFLPAAMGNHHVMALVVLLKQQLLNQLKIEFLLCKQCMISVLEGYTLTSF